MVHRKTLLFLYILHVVYCDWVADWMGPLQKQLREKAASRRLMNEDVVKMVQMKSETATQAFAHQARTENTDIKVDLKSKLEDTLKNAEDLLEKLQTHITMLQRKEAILKDAIANGRSGVSTVTVSTANNNAPHTYIVRDGMWSICNGMLQYPMPSFSKGNSLNNIYASPRCIGQEISTNPDPCMFNSVIKYETVPGRRNLEYTEDDFFCLKPAFNKTLEQYLSVPKKIMNNTCQNGVIRSFEENMQQCGQRVLSEYTYYPLKAFAASFPLEYCTERDGSCKLIVAWHLTNKTIENYEFLKKEDNFKKYFIKPLNANNQLL